MTRFVGLGIYLAGILLLPPNDGRTARVGTRSEVKSTGFAPIAYFNKRCVYCHTRDGAGYSVASLKAYTPEALDRRLVEMTDENAKAPLTDKELDVLASWVRSLGREQLFVAWVSERDGVLTFEATPGAKLEASEGTATLEKGVWTVSGASEPAKLVVTITQGKKKTVLKLAKSAVSHPRPKSTP